MPPRRRPALVALLAVPACFSDAGPLATGDAAGPATTTTVATTSDASTSGATDASSTPSSATGTTGDPTTGDASTGCPPTVWYVDADLDGHGAGTPVAGCGPPPPGYAPLDDDCDDADPDAHPGALEACDGRDNDCDAGIDEWPAPQEAACLGCRGAEYGGHVYYTCDVDLPWTDARTRCQALLADLVVIADAPENTFALSLVQPPATRLWLGLGDAVTEGSFIWVDGTALPSMSQFWSDGEPNDGDSQIPGSADCVALLGPDELQPGTWRDQVCTGTHGVLCEAASW